MTSLAVLHAAEPPPRDRPGRLFGIGDVHGELDRLDALLEAISPSKQDRLIFLGDYINYGSDSKGVIDRLLELRSHCSCIFLRGHSEAQLLQALSREEVAVFRFIREGGDKTWRSYGGGFDKIPFHHLRFFKTLKPWHEEDGFVFVHAGLRPGIPLEKQRPEDLVGIRAEYLHAENEWHRTIVSGHNPTKFPRITNDARIYIDTGAAFSDRPGFGQLTACEVRTRAIISV